MNTPEATFEQQLLFFSITPKSTFGSAYLNSKKPKLKLAKQVKKEPRKVSFPWDLGLLFVQPMKYALIAGFNLF